MKSFKAKVHPYKSEKLGKSIEKFVHQTSPAWVLTFIRWENRDTFRNAGEAMAVRKPMVVINDCVSVTVTQSKRSHTPSMSALLRPGDINYSTAVAPGDFVLVNMLDWHEYANRVAERAARGEPINKEHDGFKGIFKVQSVRMTLGINPENGVKQMMYQIQAFGMTELNNTIYFNDQVIPTEQRGNPILFFERIGAAINSLILEKGQNNVQDMIKVLISLCLGSGPSELGRTDKGGNVVSPNSIFLIPPLVGRLLGTTASRAMDIYRFIFGVQRFSGSPNSALDIGLNPSNIASFNSPFYETDTKCTGTTMIMPEYWNQVTAWGLISQYANLPINELFTCFKLTLEGTVMPTVVFRQIPFTTESFNGPGVTRFLNLPRWEIDPAMIYDFNIGRDESARINFVLVFGRNNIGQNISALMADQLMQGNFAIDADDIKRNGLRPWIISSNFDFPTESSKSLTKAPFWAKLLADSLFGGHLKLNGTIRCAGIQEPIAPGDNLQLGDVVYHIESVTHSASVGPGGAKKFETILELSNGVDARSSEKALVYGQMRNVDVQDELKEDYKKKAIMPGISDTQFSFARGPDGDSKVNIERSGFGPIPRSGSTSQDKEASEKPNKSSPTKSKGGRK